MEYLELNEKNLKEVEGGSEFSTGFIRLVGFLWNEAQEIPSSDNPGTEMWLTFI